MLNGTTVLDKLCHLFACAVLPETFFYTPPVSGRSVLADLPLALDCRNRYLNANDRLDLSGDEWFRRVVYLPWA